MPPLGSPLPRPERRHNDEEVFFWMSWRTEFGVTSGAQCQTEVSSASTHFHPQTEWFLYCSNVPMMAKIIVSFDELKWVRQKTYERHVHDKILSQHNESTDNSKLIITITVNINYDDYIALRPPNYLPMMYPPSILPSLPLTSYTLCMPI